MKKAVIYARVSSKEQEREGFSIHAQLKLLRDYATKEGFEVCHEFIDVETAKQSGRKRFGEMIGFLENEVKASKNPCAAILVEKTDRLYRNQKDWIKVDDLDLEVHLVKENCILSKNSKSAEKFMHGIRVLMAKNYIDNLSEEVKKGHTQKAEEGYYPGAAPVGYRNTVNAEGKRVIQSDPALSPFIVRIFELYATGSYSIKDLVNKVKEEKLIVKKTIYPSFIHHVLTNPLYCGDFSFREKIYKGKHEPLISKDLWLKVQNILAVRNARPTQPSKVNQFQFSGFITCGHCGCSMVGEIKKKKYVYYHCTGNKGKCNEPYTREELLDTEFIRILEKLKFDEEVSSWIKQALKGSFEEEKRLKEEETRSLNQAIDKLEKRIEQLYIDKLDGQISDEFYLKKRDTWREEQEELLKRLKVLQKVEDNYCESGMKILELANKAKEYYSMQTSQEKRKLLELLVEAAEWRQGRLFVKFKKPFDLIAHSNSQIIELKRANGTSESVYTIALELAYKIRTFEAEKVA